jgi:hypothetical protein
MRRILAAVFIVAVISACNAAAGQITMTTSRKGEVIFIIGGSGNATVNWGDGTPDVTKQLDGKTEFIYTYSVTKSRIITISGENIIYLYCPYNELTDLDVRNNTALMGLYCYHNQLTDLDVSSNTALISLYCSSNKLTDMDVSKNTALQYLFCVNNQLTNLDVSKNTVLIDLRCSENKLTGLDVSNNITLKTLYCSNNQFSADALNALFKTLHRKKRKNGKVILIVDNPGTDACNIKIAEDKGWKVK